MSDYLPPEVITQILSKLPADSVVKCTSVCKTWYAIIKDPSFVSTHLEAASLYNNLLLVRFVRDGREVYHLHRDDDTFEEYKQFRLPLEFRFGFFRVGTCNGLICLAKAADPTWNIILWNPSIHKHFILPNPGLPYCRLYHSTFGFGFDSASNDYKVLLVVHLTSTENVIEVWLFSLNRLSWTTHREVSPNQSMFDHGHAVFAEGILHCPAVFFDWKKRHASHMISAFDMSTEKVYVMNFPETLASMDYQISLIRYGESIAVVRRSNRDLGDGQCELWVMKEYGVNSSWTKVLHSVDEHGELVFYPDLIDDVVGVRKDGKVLLEVRGEHEQGHMQIHEREHDLATFDLNCHQLKRLAGMRIKRGDSFVGSFVESLVLLDIGEEDAERHFEI